jgi:hypothetical protein
VGSILAATYRSHLHLGAAVPPAVASKAQGSFGVAVHIGGPVGTAAQSAFVDGLHFAMLAAAGVALVGAVVVSALLRRRREQVAEDHAQSFLTVVSVGGSSEGVAAYSANASSSLSSVALLDRAAPTGLSTAPVGRCPTCGGETVYHETEPPSPAYYWCEHCQAAWSRQDPCDGAQTASGRRASLASACR